MAGRPSAGNAVDVLRGVRVFAARGRPASIDIDDAIVVTIQYCRNDTTEVSSTGVYF
jgi:hypothetical protein